ncbi:3'-5' exonuclease [Janibacter indicus]|uniref:3'-5' exonuclease n=1 Tax=Janibacter indicus TaxID=857417 RepID=UPI003EBD1B0C
MNGLSERGIDVRAVDQESAKPGKPLVMTMHRAKGLEFTHVLLFGIHEGSVPRAMREYEISEQDHADAMLRERSLIYVAATRARDVLAVTWSGERSPLLPATS